MKKVKNQALAFRAAAVGGALTVSLLLAGCFGAAVVGGAATGALIANDRRTPEVVLGDERVELAAAQRINQRFGERANVSLTSYNYTVLLTGEVPDDNTRQEVERMASQVERVKAVVNELQLGAPSSLSSRGNDTYLTGRIKSSFVTANRFNANQVKVVTERAVVYLMGLVNKKEADEATDIARRTPGVRKVVRVFEYQS
jgi:osmotically-inducible protein OsmY